VAAEEHIIPQVVNHQLLAAVGAEARAGMADQKHFTQAEQELPVKGTQAVLVYIITEPQQEHTTEVVAAVVPVHTDITDTADITRHAAAKELLQILVEV
jgi:hypothetical protein